jgi:hypothetical protein
MILSDLPLAGMGIITIGVDLGFTGALIIATAEASFLGPIAHRDKVS